jgi:hypothetical protein
MSLQLPIIIADYVSQLTVEGSIGATTAGLYNTTDDDGVALPTGLYYFTIDGANSNKEYISCTYTAGVLTNVKSVSRQGFETTGFMRDHKVGASVVMTDFNSYLVYIANVALNGAANASLTAEGVVQLGSAAQITAGTATGSTGGPLAITPDNLLASSYGTNIPTSAEKTVLTGITANGVLSIYYGDGSDGILTINIGNTVTLTRDSYYTNVTVNGTLNLNGYMLYWTGTLSGTGTVQAPDGVAGGNAAGTYSGGVSPAGGGGSDAAAGYLKGTNGVSGGQGTNSGGITGGGNGTAGSLGSGGVAGGNAGQVSGGNSGGGTAGSYSSNRKFGVDALTTLNLLDVISTGTGFYRRVIPGSGAGGGGNSFQSSSTGGGGGGSGSTGGIPFMIGNIWAGTFTIRAVGGNGGNGANSYQPSGYAAGGGGGGSGGNGGTPVTIYGSKTWTGTYVLTGGTAGTAGGGSYAGSVGNAGNTGTSYEFYITNLVR